MVPIALTCPVWWVARWTARMLASLAVVVACSLGAATLPIGATAHAATRPAGLPAVHVAQSGSALPGPAQRPVVRWSDRAAGGLSGAARPAVAGTGTSGLSAPAATAGSGAGAGSTKRPTGSDVAATVPAGAPAWARPSARVVPVGAERVPLGPAAATVGPRAPPAR